MKKFFLFAAAAIAALTVNAKVIDLSAVATSINDWNISEATLNDGASDAAAGKYVYDIKAEVPGESYIKAEPNVVFQIKNGSDKPKAFSIYPGKCYEFGGKNGILIVKNTAAGDVIKMLVASKGSTAANFVDAAGAFPVNAVAVNLPELPAKGSEGADEQGYVWKEVEYQALGGEVQIKEFAGGYRIKAIQIGAAQGVENTNAAVKAQKVMKNGQLVIIKNGVEYNALGAQL